MKYNLPDILKNYKILKKILFLVVVLVIVLVLKYFDINKYVLLGGVAFLGLLIFNLLIYVLLFKKYQESNYIILGEREFRKNSSKTYNIFYEENIIPNKNILYYTVKQGILMKKFNLYKIYISSSSLTRSFYVGEEDITILENKVKFYIEKNIVKEVGEDE